MPAASRKVQRRLTAGSASCFWTCSRFEQESHDLLMACLGCPVERWGVACLRHLGITFCSGFHRSGGHLLQSGCANLLHERPHCCHISLATGLRQLIQSSNHFSVLVLTVVKPIIARAREECPINQPTTGNGANRCSYR